MRLSWGLGRARFCRSRSVPHFPHPVDHRHEAARAQLPMPLPIELADALAAASGVSESSHGARYDPTKLTRFTELLATHAAKPVRPSPHSAQA